MYCLLLYMFCFAFILSLLWNTIAKKVLTSLDILLLTDQLWLKKNIFDMVTKSTFNFQVKTDFHNIMTNKNVQHKISAKMFTPFKVTDPTHQRSSQLVLLVSQGMKWRSNDCSITFQTKHCTSPKACHPCCKAWRWQQQHHAVVTLLTSSSWKVGKGRR